MNVKVEILCLCRPFTYVEPTIKLYNEKVVVLTDRGTYSAGSVTALATKALPKVDLIGIPQGEDWAYRMGDNYPMDGFIVVLFPRP